MDVQELVMVKGGTFREAADMEVVSREVGQNDVGIVAWLITLKTPECPAGRQVSPQTFSFDILKLCVHLRACKKPITVTQ